MLVESQTNASPFHIKGLTKKEKEQNPPEGFYRIQENNRERTFRRAANACELAGGVCLNSTVVFTFHLLQINPLGMFLAVGVSHFYFTATAVGEKSFSVAMVGGAASLSCLCALSEPISEWWEARVSVSSATDELNSIYQKPSNSPDWVSGVAIALFVAGLRLAVCQLFTKK